MDGSGGGRRQRGDVGRRCSRAEVEMSASMAKSTTCRYELPAAAIATAIR